MKKMRHSNHGIRIALLAGVSAVAIAAAAPSAQAADLNTKPVPMKAPPALPVAKDTWTWWIEGGAFKASGGTLNFGPIGGLKPGWGPEGAVGFDWQPFAPMHVVGQFRYGSASKSGAPFSLSGASPSGGTTFKAAGSQHIREDHWLVDFGIGRDFGLGNSNAMWTLGVRVADLRAKLTASGNFTATTFTPSGGATVKNVIKGSFTTQQRATFVGAGPRFGVQGDIPLGNQWSIDWLAGAAVLFGERAMTLTVPAVTTFGASVSDTATVFNVDAQAGLSYWFTPATKVTASYRFDGYFKALKTLNSNLGTTNIDRFYSGPMLRLTTKF
jgi:hypothetical protein